MQQETASRSEQEFQGGVRRLHLDPTVPRSLCDSYAPPSVPREHARADALFGDEPYTAMTRTVLNTAFRDRGRKEGGGTKLELSLKRRVHVDACGRIRRVQRSCQVRVDRLPCENDSKGAIRRMYDDVEGPLDQRSIGSKADVCLDRAAW